MDIDKVLIDLNIIGQLKQHDKLGVRNLPGRQHLVIYPGREWLQGPYRWYHGVNRSDVMNYLHHLVTRIERHADLFSEPSTEKTKVLRENLITYVTVALVGLNNLQETYSDDSNVIAQLSLISEKLSESSKKIKIH